ncbi:MAG: lysophospholipid acyltransferase family protein [bacterium]
MKKWFEYVPIWIIVQLVRKLPLAGARRLADLLGWILFDLLKIRRQVVLENLRRVFPDRSEEKREEIAAGCYRFFARGGVEWLKSKTVLEQEKIPVEGWKKLDRYRREGALIVTGHLGYWELLGALVARRFGDIYVYADEQSNPYSQALIDRMRRSLDVFTGAGVEGIRGLTRQLQENKFGGFVADQRPRGKPAVVPFFGHPVKSTRIPAVVARKTGAPVVPAFALRTGEDEISVRVEDPLPASRGGLKAGEEEELLEEYNRVLEQYITRYPRQYFWLHNRWKGTENLQANE